MVTVSLTATEVALLVNAACLGVALVIGRGDIVPGAVNATEEAWQAVGVPRWNDMQAHFREALQAAFGDDMEAVELHGAPDPLVS